MGKLSAAIIPVTSFQQNCTLLWDDETRQAVVVDPGGDADRILAAIVQEDLTVAGIWLTHGHLDHAGGVEALREGLGNTVSVTGPHQADKFLLDGIEALSAEYGFTGMRNARSDRFLDEGDVLELGPHRFDVLHCPGHTPGHIVFVNKEARFAQFGDVLFAGSVGRTDFPYCDPAALIRAIKTKILPLGDDMQFICGHGPGSTVGRERISNSFLR